jgi:hypothetical protein
MRVTLVSRISQVPVWSKRPSKIDVSGFEEEVAANVAERIFAINDQHVTLDAGGSPRTNADVAFIRYVPSLISISDATAVCMMKSRTACYSMGHTRISICVAGRFQRWTTRSARLYFQGARQACRNAWRCPWPMSCLPPPRVSHSTAAVGRLCVSAPARLFR